MKYRGQFRVLFLVVVALMAVMVPTPASSAGPCTDGSRACVIATAQTYLDALLSHDASKVRFAPQAIRVENGVVSGKSAADMRNTLETFPLYKVITGVRNLRWVVEGGHAVAFYLIDAQLAPGVKQQVSTAHVAEEFTVRNGLITRIDLVVCFAGGFRPESGQTTSRAGLLTDLCLRAGPKSI